MRDLFNDIIAFNEEESFLSNFQVCESPINFNNIKFKTVEHAYVASKTRNKEQQKFISSIEYAGQVKRYGKKIAIREDFDTIRTDIMFYLVYQKFEKNHELRKLLVETQDCEIVEGNYWNDTFWGMCNGIGENNLGKILMKVRTILS